MKIVIATPLYPPDLGEPASYVKELAGRLVKNHHVTVIIYGHLPEKVPGVSFISINKQHPLPIRILRFGFTLLKASLAADLLYAENGASVELPAAVTAFITRKPLILHMGDQIAAKKASENMLLAHIRNFASGRASQVISESPFTRPEILPFAPTPKADIDAYDRSWNAHTSKLEDIFRHVRNK